MHTEPGPQVDTSEDERGLVVHRYSMFHPANPKELFHDYPELRKIDEIRSMNPEDVVFCWYMGHPSSPIVLWTKEDSKSMYAIKNSYGAISERKYNMLVGLNFTEEFKIAIEKMMSFKVGTRARLLKILESTLHNWESIANVEIDLVKLAEGDNIKDVKDYILATREIFKQMPELLEQAEQGYSLKINNNADDESDLIGMLDDWHDENARTKAI